MKKGGSVMTYSKNTLAKETKQLLHKVDEIPEEEFVNSKDYVISVLGKQFSRLEKSCNLKWEQAMGVEDTGSASININRRTKKENVDLKEFDLQVRTLTDVAVKIVQIQKNAFGTVVQAVEEDEDEELV